MRSELDRSRLMRFTTFSTPDKSRSLELKSTQAYLLEIFSNEIFELAGNG